MKTAALLSSIAAFVLTGLLIEGMFYADELRVNHGSAGLRLHWSNGVLVVVGMQHVNTPDYPGWNFWHPPRSESFTPDGPGFPTPHQIADFGVVKSAIGGTKLFGFTMPLWFVIAVLVAVTAYCLAERRRRTPISNEFAVAGD